MLGAGFSSLLRLDTLGSISALRWRLGMAAADLDFRAVFEASPECYLLLSPDLVIVGVSEAYLRATMTKRVDIMGRALFEVFPDNPNEPAATGVHNLRASLARVVETSQPDTMAVQKYDIARPASEGGGFEERYWSPVNSPVLGDDGEIRCIIHRVQDVTEFVRIRQEKAEQGVLLASAETHAGRMEAEVLVRAQELQAANRRLEEANAKLAQLYQDARDVDRRQEARLAALVAMQRELASTSDSPEQLLARAPAMAQTLTNSDGAALELVDGDDFACRFVSGAVEELRTLRFGFEASLSGEAARERRTRRWRAGEAEAAADARAAVTLGLRSMIVTLLHGNAGIVGALKVFSGQTSGFDQHEASALELFAESLMAIVRRKQQGATLTRQTTLLDKAHEAIVVRGLDHRIQFWNKGAERIFGWTADEAIGRAKHELLYHDDAEFHAANRRVFELGEWSGIVKQQRKDGALISVQANWTLIRDGEGQPQSIFAIISDVTDRLVLEEQLKQSQRLEAVGQLTGGVAHDFNNLLTVVLGNAETLVEKLADQPKLRQLAQMTLTVAERGAELTHRLLAFSRKQVLQPKSFDANALVAGMEALLRRTLGEDIEITIAPGEALWPAMADPSQLEGAVLNLCLNGRDAMPGGGRLAVETKNVELDEDYAKHEAELSPGQYVLIAVSDSGAGISRDNLARVFDPFFTTKEFGKGTGLGLSMVYGFIKQSRGHIKIYSELGVGTVVKMYLPRADRDADAQAASSLSIADLRGNERILLVEDDDLVRTHAESVLLSLGYEVTAAANGPAALALLERGDAFDLLFTDVVMPGGISGRMLAERARQMRPDLKVLYTSGYTENSIVHDGRLDTGVILLSKPYSRRQLAERVREALH